MIYIVIILPTAIPSRCWQANVSAFYTKSKKKPNTIHKKRKLVLPERFRDEISVTIMEYPSLPRVEDCRKV